MLQLTKDTKSIAYGTHEGLIKILRFHKSLCPLGKNLLVGNQNQSLINSF
mgnify:CR=1 FL=1